MEEAGFREDRVRVDRWLEESQYVLGRILPGYLDDREGLRQKLARAEKDADRLRYEVDELRKTLASLQKEVQFYRAEQAAAAEAFAAMLSQLGDMQKPLAVLQRRLQATAPPVNV
jgi:chromosome segregation ATPase